jgi:cyclophilin family peptidyl-prolyl cis-trans isomerase
MRLRDFVVLMLVVFVVTGGCENQVKEEAKSSGGKVTEKGITQKKSEQNRPKLVKLTTSMGDIVIELDWAAAPVSSANFVSYVEEGFYGGTIFHRVIKDFMVQGGGFTADMVQKPTHKPIVNESKNGLKNKRGTIAMARTSEPDSATSQFYINHTDNHFLDYAGPDRPGYAVFGRVVEGMEGVDKIAGVKTTTRRGMRDVPIETVVIESAKIVPEKE